MQKTVKFVICLTLIFSIGLLMVGCGKNQETTQQPEEKTYVINIGSTASPEHSYTYAAKVFEERVEKESNGRIKVNIQFGGVLGGEAEITEAVQLGNLEMGWVSDLGLSVVVPDIGYVSLPYLFPSYDAVDKYYFNGFIGEDIKEKLRKNNIIVLGWNENDFRALTNSVRSVKTVDDLKGLKIRVPELPLFIKFFTKLGCSPTPMAVTELATALQQGTVDGQDNGVIITKSNGYEQLQDYMTMTQHMYSGGAMIVSNKFWSSLPDDLKKIIEEAIQEASEIQIKRNREDVTKFRKEIEAAGVQIDDLAPKAKQKFIDIGRSVWKDFEKEYGADWLNELKEKVK